MAKNHSNGMIKKPRSKVSKACENCRRRKIKCTGKQPCSNCVTYGCECVFAVTPVSSTTNISIDGKFHGDVTSGHSSISNTETHTSKELLDSATSSSESSFDSATNRGGRDTSSTGPQEVFDPVMDCVKEALKHVAGDSSESSEASFKKFAGSMASVAPDLAAMEAIQPNFGDNGLYKDDTAFQVQIMQLQSSLKQLKAIPNTSELIQNAITNIEKQVEELVDRWQPEFDINRVSNIMNANNGNFENMKSIESHLMKNKYTDQVFLTTFSSVTDGSKNEKNLNTGASSRTVKSNSTNGNNNNNVATFFRNKPLVDSVFGLYSPVQSLSLRGIGHFFQKCAGGPESKSKTIQLKESIYLLLRFFDICIRDFSRGCVSIASPLDDYLRKKDMVDLKRSNLGSVGSPGAAHDRDLILLLISHLPQPFIQNLTSISNAQLCRKLDDAFEMFHILLKMFTSHRNGFDTLLVKITSRKAPGSDSNLTEAENQEFLNYCEAEELLLALTYHYYNSTLYHFDEYSGSLNYVELLVSLLDMQIWLGEKYGYEKVLDVAISYSRKLGLSRWEFYVGLDEETAERRRKVWWDLYCIEKRYMCKTGRLSSTDDSMMNCLLPKVFRNLNFSDNRDFLSRVHLVKRNSAFDNMSVSVLRSYGECGVMQLASSFYTNVLYDERFTSIRNTAKPPFVKTRLLFELFEEIQKIREQFEAIKNQTSKLFEIANSSQTSHMFVSAAEKSEAVQFVLFYGCSFFSILSSTGNLVSRLFSPPKSPFVLQHCVKIATVAYDLWREMTNLLLSIDDDYTIGRVFNDYHIVCLLVATTSFDKCTFVRRIDEVVTFLRVVKRLRNITIYAKNKNNAAVLESKAYLAQSKLITFVGITTNNMLLGYMHDNNLDREKLSRIVKQCAPDVAELPDLVLNPKSDLYELLMQPVESCGYHMDVKKLFEKDDKGLNSFSNDSYPKTAVQLTPLGSESSPGTAAISRGMSPPSPPYPQPAESKFPKLPSIQSLTSPISENIVNRLHQVKPAVDQASAVTSPDVSDSLMVNQKLNGNLNSSSASFNLGTLDEFVNHGDLNDIFNTLWSDLDDNNQVLFEGNKLDDYWNKSV